jgi:hypothetical protein
MEILTPKDIAQRLKKSERWVYTHADELGGAKIGGSWFFTEGRIEDALQRKRKIQGRGNLPRQEGGDKTVFAKGGCKGMGNQNKKEIHENRQAAAERHDLVRFLHKVS